MSDLGPFGDAYNVEHDMRQAAADRFEAVQHGRMPCAEQIREMGGVDLSVRAEVLLKHYATAIRKMHDAGDAMFAVDVDGEHGRQLTTVTRRLMEYIGALESLAFLSFSADPSDIPRESIGLAAVSLEQLCASFQPAIESGEAAPETARGVDGWRWVASRLRVLEQRYAQIPGHGPVTPFALPSVDTVDE